ncbi:uncharacterized protein LOC135846761 [Planococcus citri]|uniref:uncharacterized protein LOC135846761 n=1 Tax=Planococcus citri TaxID=170843 RepID=UPI0031F79EE0
MLKQISRLFRDQLEKKLFNNRDKVDYSIKADRSRNYHRYKRAKGSNNFRPCCDKWNHRQVVSNTSSDQREEDDKTETCRTADYLKYNSWLEALGLSSTFALAYTLNQNFHARRRIFFENYNEYYPVKKQCIFKRAVSNSQTLWRTLIPKHVFTQPPALESTEALPVINFDEQQTSQAYGPPTSDEVLNDAMQGVRNAHNMAVGELENRYGMRCMAKKYYRKAVVHFSAGMALENSTAAFNLAQCYELGLGTSQDFTMAAKCYRRASDLGDAKAMYNLAIFHLHGWGGLKCDRVKAEHLLKKAAESGESNAKAVWENRFKNTAPPVTEQIDTCKNIRMREVEKVVDQVMKSTLDGYQLPHSKFGELSDSLDSSSSSISRNSVLLSEFDSSDSSAHYYSGICYEHGIGVKQNFDNAVKHYSSAAFSGSSEALYNLAACYETTAGSSQSDSYQIPLMMDLYKMAADHGHQFASERLKALEIHEVLGTLKDFFFHSKRVDGHTVMTR